MVRDEIVVRVKELDLIMQWAFSCENTVWEQDQMSPVSAFLGQQAGDCSWLFFVSFLFG